MKLTGLVAIVAVTAAAHGQVVQPSGQFDRLDRESRDLIQNIRCAGTTARLRASGTLGVPDSLGDRGVCVTIGGRFYGVILSADSANTRVSRFNVVDFGTRQLFRGVADTAAALGLLRALDAGTERGYPAYQKAKREFLGVAFRSDGDSISVWLLPQVNGPALGGMQGYLYSPDGRSLIRSFDELASFRPFAIPDSGDVVIVSRGDSLPTMSEMVVANSLNEAGRSVRIETKARSSTLVGSGARAMWVHIKKPE